MLPPPILLPQLKREKKCSKGFKEIKSCCCLDRNKIPNWILVKIYFTTFYDDKQYWKPCEQPPLLAAGLVSQFLLFPARHAPSETKGALIFSLFLLTIRRYINWDKAKMTQKLEHTFFFIIFAWSRQYRNDGIFWRRQSRRKRLIKKEMDHL